MVEKNCTGGGSTAAAHRGETGRLFLLYFTKFEFEKIILLQPSIFSLIYIQNKLCELSFQFLVFSQVWEVLRICVGEFVCSV